MPFETYVLTEKMNVSVPIFQRVNGDQRVPIVKREGYAPFLQVTVYDENGVSKNLRYKEVADTTDMDVQIKEKNIPANAKFTDAERRDRMFKKGVCITNKVNLQRYLKEYPAFEGSKYKSDEVQPGEYMLFDQTNLNRIKNGETRKRVKAAARVLELKLDEAREMLIRLNGSFFNTPNTGNDEADLEDCVAMLVDFVDASDEAGLDAVLKDSTTVDENNTVLLGKLLSAGHLNLDAVEGKVSKKGKDGKWIEIRSISAGSAEELKRMFSDFLNTAQGADLKNDLERDLEIINTKKLKNK